MNTYGAIKKVFDKFAVPPCLTVWFFDNYIAKKFREELQEELVYTFKYANNFATKACDRPILEFYSDDIKVVESNSILYESPISLLRYEYEIYEYEVFIDKCKRVYKNNYDIDAFRLSNLFQQTFRLKGLRGFETFY